MITDSQPQSATGIGLSDREEALLRACVLSLQNFRRLYDLIEDEIAWYFDEFEFLDGLGTYYKGDKSLPLTLLREAIKMCGVGTTDGDLEKWLGNPLPSSQQNMELPAPTDDEEESDADMNDDGEQGDVR